MSTRLETIISTASRLLSAGVYGRILKNKNGRLELAVIIGDNTSAEDLRNAWSAIDRVRAQLRALQGSNLQSAENALTYRLAHMKAAGWSYNALAMDVNYDCLVNLCNAAEEIPDLNAPELRSAGLSNAATLLRAVRMKDDEILYWLLPALQEIKNGNAPWPLDGGPVDGLRVRDTLRQWQREQEAGRIVVKGPPKSRSASIETLDNKRGRKAEELLNRCYPESLAKYNKAVDKYLRMQKAKGAEVIIIK